MLFHMIESDPKITVGDFYNQHYDMMGWRLIPGMESIFLGDEEYKVCRFCGRSKQSDPAISFQHEAHAIPKSLGNNILFTHYECDSCNQHFGATIENDLGNWLTLKRIFSPRGIHVLLDMDEEEKRFAIESERKTYTPVAVLKAFVKIGLTLLRVEEVPNFSEALAWIREKDHTKSRWKKLPVIQTTLPPGLILDGLLAILLVRKAAVMGVPYAFLVLAYGYETFQVYFPSLQDSTNYDRLPVFPMWAGLDPADGKASVRPLDLCGREKVKGEKVLMKFSFSGREERLRRGKD